MKKLRHCHPMYRMVLLCAETTNRCRSRCRNRIPADSHSCSCHRHCDMRRLWQKIHKVRVQRYRHIR